MSNVSMDKRTVKLDRDEASDIEILARQATDRAFNTGVAAEASRVCELMEECLALLIERGFVMPGVTWHGDYPEGEHAGDTIYDVLYNDVRAEAS